MHKIRRATDAGLLYMSELGARVAAATGRAEDRHHLGKITLMAMRDTPDFQLQIDGFTGESETNASVLARSIRCALSFRAMKLGPGDVIIIMAPNHLDIAIPITASLFVGVAVAAIDRTLTAIELQDTFDKIQPRIIFCQSEKAVDVQLALNNLQLDANIVTFDSGDQFCSFRQFLDQNADNTKVEDFKATDFDPENTIAVLIATSGTTGLPKAASASHKNFAIAGPYMLASFPSFPCPTRMALVGSPLQWLSAMYHFLFGPIFRYTRLQTSLGFTKDHVYHLINTYRPTFSILSPTFMTMLLKLPEREQCDFTCFELFYLGGSATPTGLIEDLQAVSPSTDVRNVYGMSEATGITFNPDQPPPGSAGKPMGCLQYRLVNVETMTDITEPHQQGELWLKGPGIVKGYHRNPSVNAETFAEDGWFRSGDIFYRDENGFFYFVERFKLLLKYMNNQISPVELEGVIRGLEGVHDVAVTGVPDPERGELVVACVVRKHGASVTADDVKRIVRDSLTDSKQLRGGVIFLPELPMTASTKIHRRKLKEIALEMDRE